MKGGKYYSVKDYGVIAPMYALHLLGYSLALLSLIISPVIIFVAELEVWQTDLILLYMLLIEAVICVATDVTCCIISKRKDGKKKADARRSASNGKRMIDRIEYQDYVTKTQPKSPKRRQTAIKRRIYAG